MVVSPSEVILDCGKDGTCRLPVVGETYVDYEAALPDWSRLLVRVRSSVLRAMIDNALTKSVSPNVPLDREILLDEAELTLYLEKGKLAITVRQEPEGATGTGEPVFEESIDVDVEVEVEEEEEVFRVGVNAHFLADSFRALQPADDDVVLIRFVDEYQPIVLSCEGNEDTRSVVMPVRLIRPEERFEEDATEEKDRWHHRAGSFAGRPRHTRGIRIGRNAPCPCGSGKKYKKCCLGTPNDPASDPVPQTSELEEKEEEPVVGRMQMFQLKIALMGTEPPVWRRVSVPWNISLSHLHYVIQESMGWCDSHLYLFEIKGRRYSDPDFELEDVRNAHKTWLHRVLREGDTFSYEYDFGDSWMHEIVVEKAFDAEEEHPGSACLDGARACPPEDCGGAWGYANRLEAIKDPLHEEHEEITEWVGEDFDPEAFDIDKVNARLI